jgi:hypothetical protein
MTTNDGIKIADFKRLLTFKIYRIMEITHAHDLGSIVVDRQTPKHINTVITIKVLLDDVRCWVKMKFHI